MTDTPKIEVVFATTRMCDGVGVAVAFGDLESTDNKKSNLP